MELKNRFGQGNRGHGHNPRQNHNHLSHGRTLFGIGMGAQEPHQEQQLDGSSVVVTVEPPIDHMKKFPVRQVVPDQIGQRLLALAARRIHRRSAASDLQHNGPEGVHVRLVRELAIDDHLRSQVPERSHHVGGCQALAAVHESGQPEVPQKGIELLVQHDVAGFDIAVQHLLPPPLVKVVQSRGHIHNYAEPELPRQDRGFVLRVEESLVQAPVGHVLVHQQELFALAAPSQEFYDVPVSQLGDDRHFGHELSHALLRLRAHLLHCHNFSCCGNHPSVHASESSLAQLVRFAEFRSCRSQQHVRVAVSETFGNRVQVRLI
ncbi:hypothetical protein Mapa_016766 [Marchantia paleacea]|nr:hypothetical protein Mapa_016766 [Marchantia paleacea]